MIIACAAWPAVTWISSAPRWLFFRLAILVTLVLWLPDLYILVRGQPAEAVGVLMTMHLAIGLVTYNALVRIAPSGRTDSSPRPAPNGRPTSLEALGPPTQGNIGSDQGCYGYATTAGGATLQMGGESYGEGFQLATNIACSGTWAWTWHIGGRYRTFTALLGLDSTNPTAAPIVFVGPNGKPLTFTRGRAVGQGADALRGRAHEHQHQRHRLPEFHSQDDRRWRHDRLRERQPDRLTVS